MTTTLIILSIAIAWTAIAFALGVLIGRAARHADREAAKARKARRLRLERLYYEPPNDDGPDRSHLN